MNNTIIYRPYRSYKWFALFLLVTGIFEFVSVGFALHDAGLYIFLLVMLGILSVCMAKVLFDFSKTVVTFEQDGLRIFGCGRSPYSYLPWDEFSYAYYVRSYKGDLFLVLSPKAIGYKEAKKLVNRGANSSKMCIDSAVVIFIKTTQDIIQLKEFVSNHVSHINAD